MNLLEQEVRIAVLLRLLRFPVDGDDARLDGGAVQLLHADPVRRRGDDLAFAEQRDPLRVRDQRGDVAAHEDLAASEPDDQRRVHARADNPVGLIGGDDHQRARTLHAIERAANRAREVTVEGVLDEMGNHLGVGLAEELVAARHQLGAQLAIVLDDAVVNDVDAPGAVLVRMRVLERRTSVRRPARVADADRARRRALGLDLAGEVSDLVGVLDRRDVAVRVDDRDPGRVVAPVLETAKAVEQDRCCGTGAGVADDAAHGTSLERTCVGRGYVGDGVGVGVGVGVGGGVGTLPISIVTVTLLCDRVTPAGAIRRPCMRVGAEDAVQRDRHASTRNRAR